MRKNVKANKYHFTYKLTNLTNGKIYIGVHSTDTLDDGYMGSGFLIKRAISKYGLSNFKREIIQHFDSRAEASKHEAELVDEEFVKRDDTYNLVVGGRSPVLVGEDNGFYGRKHTKTTIIQIQKSRNNTIEERGYTRNENWWICFNNKIFTSQRDILSEYNISRGDFLTTVGNPDNIFCYYLDINKQKYAEDYFFNRIERNNEKKRKLRIRAKERFTNAEVSDETREKRSKALKGRNHPWQNKINKNPEKIRKTAEFHRGRKRSEETKRKLREASAIRKAKGYVVHNKLKYITPFGTFDCINSAAEAHGVSGNTIRNRCVYKNTINITLNMIKNAPDKDLIVVGSTYKDLGWGTIKYNNV